ncbi:MAG: hypothetical protein ACREFB_00020, partial [Stellaceae bacterium]
DLARIADSFLRVIDARNSERMYKARAERAAQAAASPRRDMTFRDWIDDHFAETDGKRTG